MEKFLEFLLPFCICVVLPVTIVWIVLAYKRYSLDKKADIISKCIENGIEINPDMLEEKRPAQSTKSKLLKKLGFGVILLVAGVALITAMIDSSWDILSGMGYLAIACIAAGTGLLVWFFVGKSMLADEIAREKEDSNVSGQ